MIKQLYLNNRFFWFFAIVITLLALSYAWENLFLIGATLAGTGLFIMVIELFLLFNTKKVMTAERRLPKVMSMGDKNVVDILIENHSSLPYKITIIDELPFQFQKRDFEINDRLKAGEERLYTYTLQPKERGEYHFGKVNVFLSSPLGFAERRVQIGEEQMCPVFPSIIQMKKFELQSFKSTLTDRNGMKKIRRLGHSYEFEQIKNYVRGDDFRSVNWKATGRAGNLMVNQYEDERSQQVYCIIDKSRVMKMPFNELTLMDYAINTSLVVSNIVLQKHDKAGLMTFSKLMGHTVKAERKSSQLNNILQVLYREQIQVGDANFELLYRAVRKFVTGRSLLFLFTNFESTYAMERVLPVLRKISKMHLLVVVFFENTEVTAFAEKPATDIKEIYDKTIAEKYISDKEQMVHILRKYGIQAILTRPDELSLNSVNKYLELKSRGMI